MKSLKRAVGVLSEAGEEQAEIDLIEACITEIISGLLVYYTWKRLNTYYYSNIAQ